MKRGLSPQIGCALIFENMKNKIFLSAFILILFSPLLSYALMQISDNFTIGPGGYWGNSTNVVLELPLDFNLQGEFSISSSGGTKSTSYSLGAGKDLFFQMISLNAIYNANRSSDYLSDGIDLTFSIRPLMMLATFIDLQAEAGYSYTKHTVTTVGKNTPSHSIRVGAGLGILQTTNFAISYTFYTYPELDASNLAQLTNYARWHPALAGAVAIVSGFPGSTLDASISHSIDNITPYLNYSLIKYAADNSISNSYLLGVDYYLLENLSLSFAYNLFQDPTPSISHYFSLGTSINF